MGLFRTHIVDLLGYKHRRICLRECIFFEREKTTIFLCFVCCERARIYDVYKCFFFSMFSSGKIQFLFKNVQHIRDIISSVSNELRFCLFIQNIIEKAHSNQQFLLHWNGRQHNTPRLSKSNANTIFFRVPAKYNFIPIVYEMSRFSIRQHNVFRCLEAQFKHRTK